MLSKNKKFRRATTQIMFFCVCYAISGGSTMNTERVFVVPSEIVFVYISFFIVITQQILVITTLDYLYIYLIANSNIIELINYHCFSKMSSKLYLSEFFFKYVRYNVHLNESQKKKKTPIQSSSSNYFIKMGILMDCVYR